MLCTTNGTAVLNRLRHMPAVLVGCLLSARACAAAAIELAVSLDLVMGIVCAGQQGRFALDDALAAGVIVERAVEQARGDGLPVRLTDAARAAVRFRSGYPDAMTAFRDSASGQLLLELGAEDLELCARVDSSGTVPMLRESSPGSLMRVEEVVTLYDYNAAANERVLAAAGRVSPDDLVAAAPGVSHGSLLGTLAHVFAAEWTWRTRCEEGASPSALPTAADVAPRAA